MSQTVTVQIEPDTRPGLLACGPYRVGQPHDVDLATGLHLVDRKGFEPVSEADAERLEHYRREQARGSRQTSAPEPPAAEGAETNNPLADFLAQPADAITADGALEGVTADEARELLALEQAGKNRTTVKRALAGHLESLGE